MLGDEFKTGTIDDFTCGTKGCAAEADWRCDWPGQTIDLCSQCAQRAIGIADVMGFKLPLQLLQPIKAMVAAIELAAEDE